MHDITSNDDVGEIMKQDCYLFFYFTATWCGPCKSISSFIDELSNNNLTNNISIKFYKIDIDENELLCQTWGITKVPTFLLLKNTDLLDMYSGTNKQMIQNMFGKI